MGYLTILTEQSDIFEHSRVSGEKYGVFLNNLTRLMNIKPIALADCGAAHSELMLLYTALDYAAEYGENITVAEAAKRMGVSMPSVSRSLKGLSEKGLIKRGFDEKDHRTVKLIVTEYGEEKVQNFFRYAFSTLDEVLKVFSDEELDQMIKLHGRFVNSLTDTLKRRKECWR